MVRVAGAFDRAPLDPSEDLVKRVLTPVAKYWVTKRCSEVVREAMECLGGNGFVEESIMPRLYRESPVNAIWEGSGNVMALDVVRVLGRAPQLFEEVLAGVGRDLGPAGKGTVVVLRAALPVGSSDGGMVRDLQIADDGS